MKNEMLWDLHHITTVHDFLLEYLGFFYTRMGLLLISTLSVVASQKQGTIKTPSIEYHKICKSVHCNSMESLKKLRNCTVVLGDLKILLFERSTRNDFANISFPELREVTGALIMYRVFGLESVGKLFPNLCRIRGADLVFNYALIIYDLPDLLEIGLHSLLKIDRGGVIAWGGVHTCYIDTINWRIITNGRHVVFPQDNYSYCNHVCRCSLDAATNFCWNIKKCQRLLEGPDAEKCHDQCFGCLKTTNTTCSLCRYYTHGNQCVSQCPSETIVLQVNKFCVSEKECNVLGGWSWNSSCVFECPENYIEKNTDDGTTCERCDHCKETCRSLTIQSQANIQSAKKCTYINGSLTIHIRALLPEVLDEMRYYLSGIQEVSDYVIIHDSISITSLDFLSSLKRIKGRNLKNGQYSLIVSGMHNLQTLFTQNVTKNIAIDNGTFRFYDNPMLCMNQIEKILKKVPKAPSELDIPEGTNGYSGACDDVSLQLKVKVINETSAVVVFNPLLHEYVHYSILYVRIPQGIQATIVPEACSELEWDAINVPSTKLNNTVHVEISSFRPASTYALCVETYNPSKRHLARSSIVNFNTTVGKPEPSFITELVASSAETVVIRWVDHKDYRPHIHHYELDVSIIEINSKDIAARDHCVPIVDIQQDFDYSLHAVVMRPPKNYEQGCESMCGILSTVTAGAMTEDYFDICSSLHSGCDSYDYPLTNSSFGRYVKTLVLNLSSPRTAFQIGNLAPFRDYRFKLRACTQDKCSRSISEVVRTQRLMSADVPEINFIRPVVFGEIWIEWHPPSVTNGPVLAYYIEILPILPDMDMLLPHIWCVPSNTTSFKVNFDVSNRFIVRICSMTLGSNYICSDRRRTTVSWEVPTWWWIGLPLGILICIGSVIIGRIFRIQEIMDDETSLLSLASTYRIESEPPSQML